MDRWKIDLLFLVAIFVLPLLPALALYNAKWGASQGGETSGKIFGMSFKFAGAAGVYVLLFIAATYLRPKETDHYHTWIVEGQVQAQPSGGQHANLNDLFVRIVPPRLSVLNDGQFSWEIPVIEDSSGRLHFPNIQLDLSGYRGVTIPLSPDRAAYGAPAVGMTHDADNRTIVFQKLITLESSRVGRAYADGLNIPAPVSVAAPQQAPPAAVAAGDKP